MGLPLKPRSEDSIRREPAGFTQHNGGLASEYAREQGWGMNENERTRTGKEKEQPDGGRDYDYGARDFGDEAVDTSSARPAGKERTPHPPAERLKTKHTARKKSAVS